MKISHATKPDPTLLQEIDTLKGLFSDFRKRLEGVDLAGKNREQLVDIVRPPLSTFDAYVLEKAYEGTRMGTIIAHEFKYFVGNLLDLIEGEHAELSLAIDKTSNEALLGVMKTLFKTPNPPKHPEYKI